MLRFRCPHCETRFLVPAGSEGVWITCARCQQLAVVMETAPARADEWPALADVRVLWDCLRWRASDRKARLFACACLRRLTHLFEDVYRDALAIYERFADGLLSVEEMAAATRAAHTLPHRPDGWPPRRRRACQALAGVLLSARDVTPDLEVPVAGAADVAVCRAMAAGLETARQVADWAYVAEQRSQCTLLRDVFGPLLVPVAFDPGWAAADGGALVSLARSMYEDRNFDDLAILADALQDAGCTDSAILEHCQPGGEHVRGCWLLDLILGRE